MAVREIPFEDLVGRLVHTAAGRPAGRIVDVRAEPDGEDYVLREVILGELGFRARLFDVVGQLPTLRALGIGRRYRTRAIPWGWLDFSDPERPRFIASESSEQG